MGPGPDLGSGCYPVTWLLLALALTWPPGRDVGSGCYPDLAQGFGGGAGFGVRPVLTSLSEPIKNYQSIKKTAARDWVLPLAPGCYPDMAPAASPWALTC